METTTLGGYGQIMAVNYPVELRLIPADKLSMVLPAAMGGDSITTNYDLQVQAGTVCTNLKFKPRQCNFSENFSPNNDGGLTTSVIETRLLRPNGLMMAWLLTAAQIRWVAVVKLQTEELLVVGTPEHPLLLNWGKAAGSPYDVRIQLNGQNWHPALQLSKEDFEAIMNPVVTEFDISFDISFS